MHSNSGANPEIEPASTCFKNIVLDSNSVTEFDQPHHKPFNIILNCWLDYISKKYPNTETLSVKFDSTFHPMPLSCKLEGCMVKMLSNMPNISCYKMRFCPITDTIMNTMDNNNAKLKTIDIWTDEYDMERQFNFVSTSKQKESITSLNIIDFVDKFRVSPTHNSNIIINLVSQLQCLTQLTIKSNISKPIYTYTLLIEIIKKLPRLEVLSINSLFDDISQDVELDTDQILRTNMKDFTIGLTYRQKTTRREYINRILQFTLQSCPLLENFSLFGQLTCDNFGPLKLDFTKHDRLKLISIDVDGVVYYLFGPRKEGDPLIPHSKMGYLIGEKLCTGFCEDKVFMDIWKNKSTTAIFLQDATTEPSRDLTMPASNL